MSWADGVNGTYELIGGIFLLLNCIKLYKDKQVKGVTLSAAAFFATWSWWNMYYYPSLNQWISFSGGLLIAVTNAAWVVMAIYYTRKNKRLGSAHYQKKWAETVRDMNALDGCWEKKLEKANERIKELESVKQTNV